MVENEETSQEDTPQVKEEGNSSTLYELYDKTLKVVEQDRENLERREKLIAREEELMAKKMLSGRSDGGNNTPVKKVLTQKEKDDADIEFAKSILKGEVNPLALDGAK